MNEQQQKALAEIKRLLEENNLEIKIAQSVIIVPKQNENLVNQTLNKENE